MGHNHDVTSSSLVQTTKRHPDMFGMFFYSLNDDILSVMKKINYFIYPAAAAFVIAADQLTKALVRSNMQPGDRIPVIGDWFSIYYVQNTGTAFSMFSGNKFVTVVLTSVLIIACLVFIIREISDGHSLVPLLLTFVAAGGASNMIDRLSLGSVTDMISCGSFAVFNVADIFVTCGCILTALAILILYKDEDDDIDEQVLSNGGVEDADEQVPSNGADEEEEAC